MKLNDPNMPETAFIVLATCIGVLAALGTAYYFLSY